MMNVQKRLPNLKEVLSELGPLPMEAVFMGIADHDGCPLLFDVTDKTSPNVLIWNGNVEILKVIANYILSIQRGDRRSTDIEFVVLTSRPKEWEFISKKSRQLQNTPCVGIIPIWSDTADQILLSLAEWIHRGRHPKKSVLVLVDDVDKLIDLNFDAKQNFGYILLRGRGQQVFVIGLVKEGISSLREGFQWNMVYQSDENRYYVEGSEVLKVWTPNPEE